MDLLISMFLNAFFIVRYTSLYCMLVNCRTYTFSRDKKLKETNKIKKDLTCPFNGTPL